MRPPADLSMGISAQEEKRKSPSAPGGRADGLGRELWAYSYFTRKQGNNQVCPMGGIIVADLDFVRQCIVHELTPAKGQRGKYFCPVCGSGQGSKGTAAFSLKGVHGHCFSCGFHGDVFDLIAAVEGISLSDATRVAVERYGSGVSSTPARSETPKQNLSAWHDEPKTEQDFSGYVAACAAALPGSAGERYLTGRGLSPEIMKRFSLGYDADRGAIVIPYDRQASCYGWRLVDPKPGQHAHDNPAGVRKGIFNAAALAGADPCFVVESPLCAISLVQAGAKAAVALGGSNVRLVEKAVEAGSVAAPLILALDNDEPGRKAQEQLLASLKDKGVFVMESPVMGDCKDPNEALQKEPDALAARIAWAVEEYMERVKDNEQKRETAYQAESAAGCIDMFVHGISESASTPPVPTGFVGLDKLLDGGLYEGLYTIGAISSLGKTSFVLQLCDQIAKGGGDVLFFSLEMGRYELMAKSVSRLTYQIAKERGLSNVNAKTTRGILAGKRYERYNQTELDLIEEAVKRYKERISGHIWFVEGVGDIGTAEVRERVERHIAETGRKPVVVIDYLQILAPADVRASDKQATDRNVLELKRLSRDHKLPVIGISSLNRENYTEPINTTAFKESGAIEYGSDCLIGLQYLGMEWQEGEGKEARAKRIRELQNENDSKAKRGEGLDIEIKIMKNRNGSRGHSDPLKFWPMFNAFQEYPAGFKPVEEQIPFKRRGVI